jgi:hypothetical protein
MTKELVQPKPSDKKEQTVLSPEEISQLVLTYQLSPDELLAFLAGINTVVVK